MNEEIKRRLIFLIELAKYEKKRDQVSTYLMRVLSNHATIGMDAGSAKIKTINQCGYKKGFPVCSMGRFDDEWMASRASHQNMCLLCEVHAFCQEAIQIIRKKKISLHIQYSTHKTTQLC